MVTIADNGIIKMYRGDTFEFPLYINMGTKFEPSRYVLQENDTVYMSIGEPNQEFEHALIRKIFTAADLNNDGDVVVKLSTSDTENVVPGMYYMEMRIKLANGNIGVIVPSRKFFIYA